MSNENSLKCLLFDQERFGNISTLEEMDMKVLKVQNAKLAQCVEEHRRSEERLRLRNEQLEKRQMQDDALLTVVNRYWNQFNENIRILLEKFDPISDEMDTTDPVTHDETINSFLIELSTWDKDELDEKLANRVQVSQHSVSKIIRAFDAIRSRNEKLVLALNKQLSCESSATKDEEGSGDKKESEGEQKGNVAECVAQINEELVKENRTLYSLNNALHQKHNGLSLELKKCQDGLAAKETEVEELKNRVDDLEYEQNKIAARNVKLEYHLCQMHAEMTNKATAAPVVEQPQAKEVDKKDEGGSTTTVSSNKLEQLKEELEEQKELAQNRLKELEEMEIKHRDTIKEVETLKFEMRHLPENVVKETPTFQSLQMAFSTLFSESANLQKYSEELRQKMLMMRNNYMKQIETMENEELTHQRQLRNELLRVQDINLNIRREYEVMRIDFEQAIVANEQTGPINREMRYLITALQNHNTQIKSEVQRFKRKFNEAHVELEELKARINAEKTASATEGKEDGKESQSATAGASAAQKKEGEEKPAQPGAMDPPPPPPPPPSTSSSPITNTPKKDSRSPTTAQPMPSTSSKPPPPIGKESQVTPPSTSAASRTSAENRGETDLVRELRCQLKKAQTDLKETKLVLDMYKTVSKDQRDKVQLMHIEKKLRLELEESRSQMKRMQDCKREDRKKLADEDALRKIKHLEEQLHHMQKQVQAHKQEEEALLCEMEVTGTAYEEMQEQNTRLLVQLKEKDDANFKLVTERVKSNQLHKLALEDRDGQQAAAAKLRAQIDSTYQIVRKLEDKDRTTHAAMSAMERECQLHQQSSELNKRKAIECTQTIMDLKLHLEKAQSQVKETLQVVSEKTAALESELFKNNRLKEDLGQLKKRVERVKRMEAAETMDEVLMEEIREYKETLTCPSCKVKRKDAVLTKCFHVFCWDCLRTRYETRQRKCPKCNAAFGANDYRRLYLN